MCSIEESPSDIEAVKNKSIGKNCIKCKNSTATILIRHSTYCKQCFQYMIVGKFRKNMDRHRTPNSQIGEKVMIGLSGGPSSRAMLQLLSDYNEALPHEISKRQLFSDVLVCHVDESTIFDTQDSTTDQVEKIAQKYQYPFIELPIEDIYSVDYTSSGAYKEVLNVMFDKSKQLEIDELSATICQNNEHSEKEKLQSLLKGVTRLTAKEDFVWYLKQSLLIHAARRAGCTRLFLGDSSTRLSIKIISLTSKGRGFGLPLEISGENQWFGDVSISRPMKDITLKEIGIYNHYLGLESIFTPSMTSKLPPKASIERLTEDFIVGLEKDYPSTVSTIVRTGSKLSLQSSVDTENRCVVCLMPYQKGNRTWKDRITVMKIPSSPTPTKTSLDQNTITHDYCESSCSRDACCSSNDCTKFDKNVDIPDLLCYACRVNMRDIKEIPLPPYVAEEAEKQSRRLSLRKHIEEFLIDDDE